MFSLFAMDGVTTAKKCFQSVSQIHLQSENETNKRSSSLLSVCVAIPYKQLGAPAAEECESRALLDKIECRGFK